MLNLRRTAVITFVVALGALASVTPGWAQLYPPPALPECHVVTVVGGTIEQAGRIVVPFQGTIRVAGEAGCASATGTVEIDAQSHRFNLGRVTPNADGSYRSGLLRLPAHMRPGPHRIMPTVPGRGLFVCPILVVADPAAANLGGVPNPAGGGGGGGLNTTGGGGGGGGILPKTGSGILALVMWALALLGIGTGLVFAARRDTVTVRLQPRRLFSLRFRSRGRSIPALPAPDVPFMDTAGFVPVRPQATAVATSVVTEADVVQETDAAGGDPSSGDESTWED